MPHFLDCTGPVQFLPHPMPPLALRYHQRDVTPIQELDLPSVHARTVQMGLNTHVA